MRITEALVQLTGSATFDASRDRVWAFLADPSRLGPCSPIPITHVDAGRYRADAQLGSGFLSAAVRVEIEVVEAVADVGTRIAARGGASGTNVDAEITLRMAAGPAAGPVAVNWELDVTASGYFGGQAVGLIERGAPDAIERLLACVRRAVEDGEG